MPYSWLSAATAQFLPDSGSLILALQGVPCLFLVAFACAPSPIHVFPLLLAFHQFLPLYLVISPRYYWNDHIIICCLADLLTAVRLQVFLKFLKGIGVSFSDMKFRDSTTHLMFLVETFATTFYAMQSDSHFWMALVRALRLIIIC